METNNKMCLTYISRKCYAHRCWTLLISYLIELVFWYILNVKIFDILCNTNHSSLVCFFFTLESLYIITILEMFGILFARMLWKTCITGLTVHGWQCMVLFLFLQSISFLNSLPSPNSFLLIYMKRLSWGSNVK